jgi:hypothetical protein
MAHQPSRWALLASVVLHLAVLAGPLLPGRGSVRQEARVDFWAGTTFEPSEVAEPGAAVAALAGGAPAQAQPIEVEGDWAPPSEAPEAPPLAADPTEGNTAAHVRAHAARRTRTRSASSGGASQAGTSGQSEGARPGGGTFGAEGAAPGTRDLLRSFVRALPTVASSDDVWSSLPLGNAGSTEIVLAVDENSQPRLGEGSFAGAPAHLRRLIQKTLVVLASGRFAPTDTSAHGNARVKVAVTLTQLHAPSELERAAGGVFGLGFEGADAHQVSRAFFTLASGRHVELTVKSLAH